MNHPTDIALATTIMQGLLASGHYTKPLDHYGEEMPSVRCLNTGHADPTKRYPSIAVIDAISLLRELKAILKATE